MILQKEIATVAAQKGLVKTTIDKDWTLGHFLDAIFSVNELRDKLLFKGGTCLRKCYLPEYRFSEDLDFTSKETDFVLTRKHLSETERLLHERVGLQTYIESLKDIVFRNRLVGFEAVIKFWGADHPRNETPPQPQRWQTKVKIEIILYEIILFPVSYRDVIHPYSDVLTGNAKQIPCYAIEEVLSEKMRSLVQRSYSAPRDLYDLWYLSGHFKEIDLKMLSNAFNKKMAFKGHRYTGIEQLLNPENERHLKSAWKNSLGNQIHGSLPEFETVKLGLKEWFSTFL